MRRGLERRLLRVVDVVRFECIMLAVLIVGVCSVFSQDTSLLNVAVLDDSPARVLTAIVSPFAVWCAGPIVLCTFVVG